MPRTHETRWWWLGSTALVIAGFAVAFLWLEPAPPETLRLATGSPGGAYSTWGERYREILAEDDIEVELVPTAGSRENLELLRDGRVDLAFVQSGVTLESTSQSDLESLGALYIEPLWIFVPTDAALTDLRTLAGRAIGMGTAGSGTRAIVETLLGAAGITDPVTPATGTVSEQADRPDEIAAIFLVAAPTSTSLRALFADPRWRATSLPLRDAHAHRFRDLTSLRVPRGVIDLATILPEEDLALVAPAATLVHHPNFHPALVDLVLMAAERCHAEPTLLTAGGTYPTVEPVSYPLANEARRFHQRGPSFLRRVLPFWAATWVDRWFVFLLPFLTLLIPLARVVPPLYRWRIRRGIKRWYGSLRRVEESVARGRASVDDAQAKLAQVERAVDTIEVPPSYGDELYQLRLHLEYVRERVARRRHPD